MKNHHTSLFLIELLLGILAFLLASALCIELFAKSYLLNQDSKNLTNATRIASNVAEIYKAHKLESSYSPTPYFNSSWVKVNHQDENVMHYTISDHILHIQIKHKNKTIYKLSVNQGSEVDA